MLPNKEKHPRKEQKNKEIPQKAGILMKTNHTAVRRRTKNLKPRKKQKSRVKVKIQTRARVQTRAKIHKRLNLSNPSNQKTHKKMT